MIHLPDEAATARLGADIAALLQAGDAVCLYGPLGAGKSTLARGLIRALTAPDEDVPSPTFTLVQTYEAKDMLVAHFDLYRLEDAAEIHELALDEALDMGCAIIEWPDRLAGRLPPDRLDVILTPEGDGRAAEIIPHGALRDRTIEL